MRRLSILAITLVAAVALYFPARDYSEAASVLLHIENPQTHAFVAEIGTHAVQERDTTLQTPGGQVRARLYTPANIEHAPGLVLVHGVHYLGIDEPRLVNFARALSSHGIVVFTPEVPALADYTVDANSVPIIGASVLDLSRQLSTPRVGLMGLSFAGRLSLIAAADPRFSPHVAYVAAIGAHDDLYRVLRFFATDEIAAPDGTVLHMEAHEYGPLVVAYSQPEDFFSASDAPRARQALRLLLEEHGKESEAVTRTLSPAGQKLMQALYQKHRSQFDTMMLAHLETHQAAIAAASPAGKVENIRCPVFLLHGAGDNVIPPTETLWLAREIPAQYLRAVLISPAISHVEIGGPGPSLADKLALLHWMEQFLTEAKEHPSD